jgi:hypothetical protein
MKAISKINLIALVASICLLLFALLYFPESFLHANLYRQELDSLTDLESAKLRLRLLLSLIDYAQGFSTLFSRMFLLFNVSMIVLLALNIRVINRLRRQIDQSRIQDANTETDADFTTDRK